MSLPKMRKTLLKLNDNLLVHLSVDHYQLNIIYQQKQIYKIQSEQKIIFYEALSGMTKSYMHNNTVVYYYYVFVVDSKYTWSLFRVKSGAQDPLEVYSGKIMSEKYELKGIIGMAEVQKKVLLIFSGFRVLYLHFPEEDQVGKQIMTKQYIPYGNELSFEHDNFAIHNGYLPNEQQNQCLFSHYNQLSPQKSIFILVYRSIIYKLYSLYTVIYDHQKCAFMSGKSTLYNVEYDVCSIFSTPSPDIYLIQTKQNLIIWNIDKHQEDTLKYQIVKIRFRSTLTPFVRNNSTCYLGITSGNEIKMVGLKKESLSFYEETINTQPQFLLSSEMNTQEIYSYGNLEHWYLVNNKLELLLLVKKNNEIKTIMFNENTRIVASRLYLNASCNFIVIEKVRGKQHQTIIYGNHLFVYDTAAHLHGIIYNMATVVDYSCSPDTIGIVLTSPLIGLHQLNFSCLSIQKKVEINKHKTSQSITTAKSKVQALISGKSFEFSVGLNEKLSNDETFFLNKKLQIVGEQIKQLESNKGIKISKLFQDSIQYISNAVVIGNQMIILSVNEQIHVFDSKYKRKYIYCCNSEIKRMVSLNDVNLLGVELFQADFHGQVAIANQLVVLVLEEEKASKLKVISIPNQYHYIQLSTVINTADYKLNLFGDKIVICSNDALHKYQLEKIQVSQFKIPLPFSPLLRQQLLPIFYYSKQRNNTDFLLIFKQEVSQTEQQYEEIQVYFASFNSKYLFNKVQLNKIGINYEKSVFLTNAYRDNYLFAMVNTYDEGDSKNVLTYRNLMLFGQRTMSIFNMKFGRIQLQWVSDKRYISGQLDKIEKILPQIIVKANKLPIQKPLNILTTNKKQYYLISNSRQIYYSFSNINAMETISYYSLINDDFTIFRNNIGLQEIQDEQYMSVFNKKMVIKDIKYLNDQSIFVLYENSIVVLEIGFNKSLVVRQELKFNSNESADIVKIQQFLQNYDKDSIFLRQFHGRIFVLKLQNSMYGIVFHSHMDEDVLLFSKVSNWDKRQRNYLLEQSNSQNSYQEELILKKDGQLLIKNMKKQKKKQQKNIYL